ncbi:MAG: Nif3-like dinuclear metal center hexameric protein [Clostridia bacterium]|nr:Nif3-like dinuclear metal center hexameric protein [Clostridia bacterium]
MKIRQIVEWLNGIAPFESAEAFDNVGLLMGDGEKEVHTVLFGMDVTEALAAQAIELGTELIITHHPFIFHALKRIDYSGPQGRTLCMLAQHQIGVIAAHTNWDKAPGGVGDALAAALELKNVVSADDYVRVGELPAPLSPDSLSQYICEKLHIIPRCYPTCDQPITRIAVAGGAYGEGYPAAIAFGAQAYIVGEAAHHEILDACARGLTLYDAGHYATELPGVHALYQRFLADSQQASWSVSAHLHDKAPYAGAILACLSGVLTNHKEVPHGTD